MAFNQITERVDIVLVGNFAHRNKLFVQAKVQIVVFIKNVGNSAAHSSCKVSSCRAKNDCRSACHIFKSVVAASFCNGNCTGITNAETLAGKSVYVRFAACCAVKGNVSDDDVFFCLVRGVFRRINNDFSAAQTFSKIVVCIAFKSQRHSLWNKRAEALSAAASTVYYKRIVFQRSAKILLDF